MRLYLVRHSVAEPPSNEKEYTEDDSDVELTQEGEEIVHAIGQRMAETENIPVRIFASATIRAQRTAEIIAEEIGKAGYPEPEVETDVSIGPKQSVRGLIQRLIADKSRTDIALVSHHEAIVAGLRALNLDNGDNSDVDKPAMGEFRSIKVKRGSGKWKEKDRIRPSDLDLADHY